MLSKQEMDELMRLLRADLAKVMPPTNTLLTEADADWIREERTLGAVAEQCLPLVRADRDLAAKAYRAYAAWPRRDEAELIEFVLCVHQRGEEVAAEHGPWVPLLKDEAGEYFHTDSFAGLRGFTEVLFGHCEAAGLTVREDGWWTYVYPPVHSLGQYQGPLRVFHAWVLTMLRDGFRTPELVEALAQHGYQQDVAETVLRDGIARPLASGAL